MTCKTECTQFDLAMELLIENGFEGLAETVGLLMNTAMQIERSKHLKADLYERKNGRLGYANGYKPKTMKTRFGEVNLAIPQTRDTEFYPQSLKRGLRSERALKLALAEMYVQGVSTRKVAKITEELCGFAISSSEVSRASKLLDEQLQTWRDRPLGPFPYVYLDARYEKVRYGGVVVSCAVLLAVGINASGRREVLGSSVKLSEHEVHWRDFLGSLKDRGLCGVRLFISDAHEGLKAARQAIFPTVPWQRCQFHLQQNAQHYVPRRAMKQEVAERLRGVFTAPSEEDAERLLDLFINDYKRTAPELATWAETAVPEGLKVMDLPQAHRRRLRTVNMLERLNKEIKRRTRVATIFPNTASCLRLVSAVAMEISEEWETGRMYLAIENITGSHES
ncbi:MAG: IS256 family transposase [Deltaproteobacteria bacterium]|nr:IS256 family transposase [Deltaproteobacteria bacterium]